MRYRTILFDADDTLLDYAKSEVVALERLLAFYGLPCSGEIAEAFTGLCGRLWSAYGLDHTDDPAISRRYHEIYFEYSVRRFELLKHGFPLAVPARQLSDRYLAELSACTFLTDGAYETCRSLAARHKLCVITNGLWEMQRRRFAGSRVGGFISSLIVSENARYAKPSPRFFEYAVEKSAVGDLSQALVVGDSLVNDIGGGAAFGIDTCWFNGRRGKNSTAVSPTYEITDLRQLPQIVG